MPTFGYTATAAALSSPLRSLLRLALSLLLLSPHLRSSPCSSVGVDGYQILTPTKRYLTATSPAASRPLDHDTGSSPQKPTAWQDRTMPSSSALPVQVPSSEASSVSRRNALIQAQGLLLSTTLMGGLNDARAMAATDDPPGKTIVMTGANSGIGFEACKRLAQNGGGTSTIVLACKSLEKAQQAVNRLQETTTTSSSCTLIPACCDLADLRSIQSFVQDLSLQTSIDVLCLNAGIARNTAASDCARTKDGFELTVGINHFGHVYLNQLLLDGNLLSPTAHIVVTASGVHDPASPGGAQGELATLGQLTGLERQGRSCQMIDGGLFNADKAYKDSKLCNVLYTQELQRRLAANSATKDMIVNCFSPGLIVGSGLFRDQNPVFTKLFDVAATNLFKVGETVEWGGASLAYMTSISTRGLFYNSPPGSSKYGDAAFGREFAPTPVSIEAQDAAKAKRLYDLSLQLLLDRA